MQLKYIPSLKNGAKTIIVISFFVLALILYLALVQFGSVTVIVFCAIYILFMAYLYNSMKNHYLEINENEKTLNIHTSFSVLEIEIAKIKVVDVIEEKRSYRMYIEAEGYKNEFTLTGSLYKEEPPLVPFVRKLYDIKPTIGFGDYCIGIFHGDTKVDPWSVKMYLAYWARLGAATGYFILLLLLMKLLT